MTLFHQHHSKSSHLIDRRATGLLDEKKAIFIVRMGVDEDQDLAVFGSTVFRVGVSVKM